MKFFITLTIHISWTFKIDFTQFIRFSCIFYINVPLLFWIPSSKTVAFSIRFPHTHTHRSLFYIFCISLCFSDGEGNGTPLQYSCLEIPMDGGAWWAAVLGVAKCRSRLSNFTFTFHFHALEKEMAPHSSVLAWRIIGTGEPGGMLSMGLHRVRHESSDLAAAAAALLRMF